MGLFATFNTVSRREYAPENTNAGNVGEGLTFSFNESGLFTIVGTDENTSVAINWGDGNSAVLNGLSASSHSYPTTSTKKITITGNIGIRLQDGRFGTLLSWGTDEKVNYITMKDMFKDAKGFTISGNIYTPNIANVKDMSNMFANSSLTSTSPSISNLDTSNVSNMSHMFYNAANIGTLNLSNWNTGNVTDMGNMFAANNSTISTNPEITNWNTSNVVNMSYMFYNNLSFNDNIGSWNTGNVTNMASMFEGAVNFNQPINSWSTGNVVDMSRMFFNAQIFNRDLSSWCVTKIPSQPTNFDTNATNWSLSRPIWGTCPP